MTKFIALLPALLLTISAPAVAQTAAYPQKTVRVLVGFPPGGGVDVMGRVMAQKLTDALGRNFIVENRPGATGNIGADLVAKSAPDGYTLLMTSIVHSINPSLFSNLPFDAVRDFAGVSSWSSAPNGIAVHPSLPVRSMMELVTLARQQPDALSYASAGGGTLMHMGMALFLSMAKVKMLHIPYNGSSPSTLAVIGGQVPVLSTSLGTVLPHARSGRLRLLAVSSAQRTALAPDIPAAADAAKVPGYEAITWIGLLAPAATPSAVVTRLNAEIDKTLKTREVREQLAAQAWDAFPNTPAAFSELIRSDAQRWGRIIKEAGIKSE